MRIVHINTNDIRGGAARAAYRLHRGLLEIGEDSWMLVKRKDSTDDSVLAVTPENQVEKFDEELFLGTVVQGHYIDSHRTGISNTIFSLPYPGCDLSALPLVQTADIVNLHWVAHHYQSLLSLQKLFALGKPVVWTLHDQWAFTGGCHYVAGCEKYRWDCVACPQLADDPFDLTAAVLKDKLELFKGANLTIITPSRWLAACARESRLFKSLRIEVIPYSLETEVFSPLPKAEAKKSLGLVAEAVTLLFGTDASGKRKGFQELVDAIRFCLEDAGFQELVKNDKIRLLRFGRPGDELEAVGIPVVSLGYVNSDEKIRTAYAAADLFILPSLEDNLPNTMLEAMSCGTPVVAFDVGGIPDVIVNGVTGQLASVGDARQLGEAILSLVFDPDRREEMGQNCRKTMVEGYSLAVQAQRYLALYQELHWEYELSTQVVPTDSTAELDQTGTGPLSAHLETALGPHSRDIYDQVLFKALKEFAPARERAYQAVREQLKRQGEQLKLQSEQLKRQSERLERQDEQLKRLTAENRNLNLQLSQLRNSWSWKITAPLRKVLEILRKLRR